MAMFSLLLAQMELPNSQGLFFTSQIVTGGEIFVAYDKALRKYWPIVINQVYVPPKVGELGSQKLGSVKKLGIWLSLPLSGGICSKGGLILYG